MESILLRESGWMTRVSRLACGRSRSLLEAYLQIKRVIIVNGNRVPGSPSWKRHTCCDTGSRESSGTKQEDLREPREPQPDECCGKGCVECVWTVYWDEMTNYRKRKAAQEGVVYYDPFQALEQRLAKAKDKDSNEKR